MANFYKLNLKIFFLFFYLIIFVLDFYNYINFGFGRLFYEVDPMFADLITIIPSKVELNEIILNEKLLLSSTETMNRSMNYPILWVYIFDFIGNFTVPHIFLGNIQIIIYLFTTIAVFSYFKQIKFINLFIILSPPIFLLFDRGNNDLIIFLLILISIYTNSFLSGVIIGLAAALKIYPLFLFLIFLYIKKKKSFFLIGFLITLPLIYFSFSDLYIYITSTSISFSSSFGLLSFALFLKKISLILFNFSISTYLYFFISIMFFIILMIFLNYFLNDDLNEISEKISSNLSNMKLFLIFFSLSLFIFIIFSSWAYRIIFLIPATVVLINHLNITNLLNIKKILTFCLITAPFLTTWIILPINQILLNHYSWAFYSLIALVSFSFYSLILIKILKINKFKSYE
tara:strand:- start:67 stop:1269 length:1203 start_codon:yes stop_codon:yes gene_type:complete